MKTTWGHWILAANILGLVSGARRAATSADSLATRIDAYVRPYVETANFAGVVLVARGGQVLFERAYGFADHEHEIRNTSVSRFHVASISMQFTAAAVLRLVDQGRLRLDDSIGDLVHGVPGAERITIRDLLLERSGLPDVNVLPDYNEILQRHQTPTSLVAWISGKALLFAPGTRYLHEEHSAYNVLALLLERATRHPFAGALRQILLRPLGLRHTFVDDDSISDAAVSHGYQPVGVTGLAPSPSIHWSGKAGNASIVTTAEDEARFVHALFLGRALGGTSQRAVLDTSPRVGYGWFRGSSERFGETDYEMSGRAPGFASLVLYLPRSSLTVVVFSNIYSSATIAIGNDIANIVLDRPHGAFEPAVDLSPTAMTSDTGSFQFGADFFQPNAVVSVVASDTGLTLRWPSGTPTVLIPLADNRFVDRSYWVPVTVERNAAGRPAALVYDRFRGTAVAP